MRTLHLTVSETAYEKLKVIFSLFGKKDLVVNEDDFAIYKKHLHKELAQINDGTIELIDSKEAEHQLDAFVARL
jgi:hypothetical protein